MIYHILYISEKSAQFQNDVDLEDILLKSRFNNRTHGITGILIKNGNFFIQLLEGKKELVAMTLDKIAKDPRHGKVRPLMNYQDATRIFPQWDMGLAREEDHSLELKELIPLIHADLGKLESSKEKILSILKKFNKVE